MSDLKFRNRNKKKKIVLWFVKLQLIINGLQSTSKYLRYVVYELEVDFEYLWNCTDKGDHK